MQVRATKRQRWAPAIALLALAGLVGAAEAGDKPRGVANTWGNGGKTLDRGFARGDGNSDKSIGTGVHWAGVNTVGTRATSHAELNVSTDASSEAKASSRTAFQLTVEQRDGWTYEWQADAETWGFAFARIEGRTPDHEKTRVTGSADIAGLAGLAFSGDLTHGDDLHAAAHSTTEYTHRHDVTLSGSFSAGVSGGVSQKEGAKVGGSASGTAGVSAAKSIAVTTSSHLGSSTVGSLKEPEESSAANQGSGSAVRVDCLAFGKASYSFTQEGTASAVGRAWADIVGQVGLWIVATPPGLPTTGGGGDDGPTTGGGDDSPPGPLTGNGPFDYRVRAYPVTPLRDPTGNPYSEGDGTLQVDTPSEPVEDEDGPPQRPKVAFWQPEDFERAAGSRSGGSAWTPLPDCAPPGTTTRISEIAQGLATGRIWIERAIVTSPGDALGTFFVQAPGGGAWSGLAVAGGPVGLAPDVGDTLALVGEVVDDDRGRRLVLVSDQDALYLEPETPSVTVLPLPLADWEPYAGVLVDVGTASLVAPVMPESPLVTDGGIQVDTRYDDAAADGGTWSRLRGVLVGTGATPVIAPRDEGDLIQ